MQVDTDRFMKDGFLVLQNVIPSDRLDEMRTSYEALVEQQKAVWARERGPDDPPGGLWETHQQPRLNDIQDMIDESTAGAIDVWLFESTLGVSRQLIRAPEVTITELMLMCSPVRDHPGGTGWHRDFHPRGEGPMEGLQTDMLANGPSYVQWNIPLYDDDVLWVVPGSHRRFDTEEEDRQMREDPKTPLPGSIQVNLKAGDGVVYTNKIWHWGNNYSTRLRRTVHGGHCSIGGPLFPYVYQGQWDGDMSFTRYLTPSKRAMFERWSALMAEQRDVVELVLRAILTRDAPGFRAGLARLHSGEKGRIVCVVTLLKLLAEMYTLSRQEVASLPPAERRNKLNSRGYFNFHDDLARRFSSTEVDTLIERFSSLDAKLQAGTDQVVPWVPERPSRYVLNEMPAGFEVDDFIESW